MQFIKRRYNMSVNVCVKLQAMVGKHRHAIKKFKNEEDQGNNGGSWGFSMECEIYIFDGSILQITGKSHVKKTHGFGYWDILSNFVFTYI